MTIDLPEDLWKRFQQECKTMGWSLKRAAAAALYSFIRDYGQEAEHCYRDVYANWPLEGGHSELMDNIPSLHSRLTGRDPADADAGQKPGDLGAALSQDRSPRKQKSG